MRPLVEQQLAEIRALADLGELDVLVWLETWRRVFQLRLEVLEAATEEARAAVALGWLVEPWSPRVFESGEADR